MCYTPYIKAVWCAILYTLAREPVLCKLISKITDPLILRYPLLINICRYYCGHGIWTEKLMLTEVNSLGDLSDCVKIWESIVRCVEYESV